jgi:hypothetical protein
MKPLLLSIACAVALAACSKAKQPEPPPPPPPPQKTVIDTQLKALQKAKDVQNVVDDQKKKQDKQLEDSGG